MLVTIARAQTAGKAIVRKSRLQTPQATRHREATVPQGINKGYWLRLAQPLLIPPVALTSPFFVYNFAYPAIYISGYDSEKSEFARSHSLLELCWFQPGFSLVPTLESSSKKVRRKFQKMEKILPKCTVRVVPCRHHPAHDNSDAWETSKRRQLRCCFRLIDTFEYRLAARTRRFTPE